MISVLFLLNLAVDARHQSFSIVSRFSRSSSSLRNIVVSSANRFTTIFSPENGSVYPLSSESP